jgi:response regulator of citrate/malate metabolism
VPLETVAPPFLERRNRIHEKTTGQGRRNLPMNVLSCVIADNSLALQKQYALALSRTRCFRLKETATTGMELEECLQRGNLHIVLLDIYLREWNGVDSLRQARALYPRIDWMILSGDDDPDIVRGCVCLGVFDYLIKPFPVERLERALHAYYQYHMGLTQRINPWKQKELDMVTSLRGGFPASLNDPPKGIQTKLLDRFRTFLACYIGTISASGAGEAIGVSRSTARRYLEYLVETGEATFEYDISDVGRPLKLYRLLK